MEMEDGLFCMADLIKLTGAHRGKVGYHIEVAGLKPVRRVSGRRYFTKEQAKTILARIKGGESDEGASDR